MDTHTNETGQTDNIVPAFYGSMIKKSKACGYCWKHHLYLTVSMMKTRECLGKQCDALCKLESHDHWRQLAQKKELRKHRKQILATYYN